MGSQRMEIEDRYVQFMRDLSKNDGAFPLVRIMRKHKVPNYIGARLKYMGLITTAPRTGPIPKGTVWCGGEINDQQLKRWATDLYEQYRKYSRDRMRESRKAKAEKNMDYPTPAAPESKESANGATVTVNIAPRTINILWGLFKFTY